MSNIGEVIEATSERFTEIAPKGMLYPAEKGYAIQILKANDYLFGIAEKHPASLQQAIVNIAAIGLSLSPAEKLAYLIPRKGKVCLDISYMGMCRIATNSGSIEWIQAELVYSNDEFSQASVGEKPHHKFNPFAKIEKRGDFIGGYCVAKTSGGDYLTTMMSAEDIYGIRDRSEAYKSYLKNGRSCPWVSDFGPMAKKTIVRRGFNMWPKTDKHNLDRMAAAVQISNENEGFELLKTSPDLGQYTDEMKIYFDQLLTDDNAMGIYVLQRTIESATYNNLYHSFEKGQKGQYQKIIDDLYRKGKEIFGQYVDGYREAREIGDDMAITQIREEISEDAFNLIEKES